MSDFFFRAADTVPLWSDAAVVLLVALVAGVLYLVVSRE